MRISDWSSDVCSSDLLRNKFPSLACPSPERGGARRKDIPGPLHWRKPRADASLAPGQASARFFGPQHAFSRTPSPEGHLGPARPPPRRGAGLLVGVAGGAATLFLHPHRIETNQIGRTHA